MNNKDGAALRKRAQIAKTNKVMLLWAGGCAVAVSAAIVLSISFVQRSIHTQKAIDMSNVTLKSLEASNAKIPNIENQVRALGSDEALLRLRTNSTDSALRVILDALPADSNPSALGSSLQNKLFKGVEVDRLQVDALGSGSIVLSDDGSSGSGSDTNAQMNSQAKSQGVQSIGFQFTVKGSPASLKNLLTRLEKSIRTIQITSLKLESDNSGQYLKVEGLAYYQPSVKLQLETVQVKP